MNRSTARAHAMKLVYEWEMGGDGGDDTRFNLLEVSSEEAEYGFMNEVFEGVVTNQEKIDALLSEFTRGWTLDRLSRVDLAILRVAVYELMMKESPAAAIISEAISLAAEYSGEKATGFVNGVLGSVSRSGKI